MCEEKRDEDPWHTDGNEPFVSHVAGRVKREALLRKFLVELLRATH